MVDRQCPQCQAWMLVYDSHVVGSYRHRYLKCPRCGYLPAKEVVPLQYAPRRLHHRPRPPRRRLGRRR